MQSSRDLGLHVSSKLSGDWSAANVTGLLSEPVLEHLLARWETLDPLVRARLLLSPLFLRKKDLRDLQPELQQMAEVGCGDRDEWVRVLARAVGPYDGRLHLEAVLKDSKLVGKTLNELRQLLEGADPSVFRSLEELYLNQELRQRVVGSSPAETQHQHFRARQPSEAPSARQAGSSAATAQRGPAGGAAAQMAGGLSHWAPRTSRPQASTPQADLFLPSKPVQRLHSGTGALFVGSGSRGGGAAAAAAARANKRPALLDPGEVRRMNEEAAKERERKAAEAKAAREAEARQRAEQRAAERAARGELKRKRSTAPAGGAEASASKTPRTTDQSEVPQLAQSDTQAAQAGEQQQQQGEQQGGHEADRSGGDGPGVAPGGDSSGQPRLEVQGGWQQAEQQPPTEGAGEQQAEGPDVGDAPG
ncbi:hypothetical protein N2152v2_010778 [Parachlorella kessleri]